MKMLKKLALVSAVSMISVGSFAMEAMDEETMSATTGQDGITINIVPDAITRTDLAAMSVTSGSMDQISLGANLYKGLSISEIRVHDDDGVGVAGTATANSGALVIGGGLGTVTEVQDRTVIFSKGDKPIQLNIDMIGDSNGSAANGGAMLNIEAKLPTTAIKLGNIYVANSNAAEAGRDADGNVNTALAEVDGTTVSDKVKILDGLEIVLGESKLIIQLGNEDSNNHMIQANSTLLGGLSINNFALYDESGSAATTVNDLILSNAPTSGGSIRAKSIQITNNDGTGNLTTVTGIDVGSRIASTPATVASLDPVTQLLIGKPAADSTAAATALAAERDVQAARLFAGATYSALSAADKATVDATSYVQTAQTAATTAAANAADAANAAASVNAITTKFSTATPNITSTSTYADVSTAATNLATAYTNANSTAGRDAATNTASSGAFTTYAAATTAATNLTTLRDAEAVTQFGAGSTYATLTTAQQASVNTSVQASNAAAYTAGVNGASLVAGVDANVANIKKVSDAAAALKNTADYRKALVEAAAANTGTDRTWGGVDTYNGLVISSQLGGSGGVNMSINNLALGDSNAAVMGDVQIIGLRLGASKIVIMGH